VDPAAGGNKTAKELLFVLAVVQSLADQSMLTAGAGAEAEADEEVDRAEAEAEADRAAEQHH
jgi:hypothetical protein